MLRNYVSPELFRKGISNYLKQFIYSNADSVELFRTIQEAYGKNDVDLVSMMQTWIEQMNYPEVKVKSLGNGQFELTQERFLTGPGDTSSDRPSKYG